MQRGMKTVIVSASTLITAMLWGGGLARADARDDLASHLSWYAIVGDRANPSDEELKRTKEDCLAEIAAAKKHGVKDTDTIRNLDFGAHPKATPIKEGFGYVYYEVSVAEAGWFCEQFTGRITNLRLRKAIGDAYDAETWLGDAKPEDSETRFDISKHPKACLDAIDAATTAGVPASTELDIKAGKVTLSDARAHCTEMLAKFKAFETEVRQHTDKKQAALEAKYKAVGIKGKRLELFAYYDMEWYLPGCGSSTGDPKKLKKAKKLFQWLTGDDGLITIRKYTFKGDNYTITEKTTYSEDKAYKLCR